MKIAKLNSLIRKQTLIINELQKEVDKEKDYLLDVLFDRQQEVTNHKIHKETLEKLLEQLYQTFYFLKTYEENRVIPLTVFGHRNYDAMQWFYQELKDFLENSTSYNHIIEVFSLENRNPISKIELVNGTLNDYAHLINELEPYFTKELRARSQYNQWWSDRFVFTTNGNIRVEKTKDAISTMRSNTRKDPSRKSSKRSKINQIVQTIANIPQ
ncbi:MAG: hypothetical protein HRT67_02870 [Flavobacteriaceae bacterium]|nr:hypothetical protein [Flavobacteriaceae bacterium]